MLGICINHLYLIKYFWAFSAISVEQSSKSANQVGQHFLINAQPPQNFFHFYWPVKYFFIMLSLLPTHTVEGYEKQLKYLWGIKICFLFTFNPTHVLFGFLFLSSQKWLWTNKHEATGRKVFQNFRDAREILEAIARRCS